MGFWVWGLGCRIKDSGFKGKGLGFIISDSGWGLGFEVKGWRLRVKGSRLMA